MLGMLGAMAVLLAGMALPMLFDDDDDREDDAAPDEITPKEETTTIDLYHDSDAEPDPADDPGTEAATAAPGPGIEDPTIADGPTVAAGENAPPEAAALDAGPLDALPEAASDPRGDLGGDPRAAEGLNLGGSAQDDVLTGGAGDDMLQGEEGNDILFGNSGDDMIKGGTGNDRLEGRTGDDLLIDGVGTDTLSGGEGHDTIIGSPAHSPGENDRDFLDGGAGDDDIVVGAMDFVTGGDGADHFTLSSGIAIGEQAEIVDFKPSEDKLVLLWDDGTGNAPPELELGTIEDAAGMAQIILDGVVVAHVSGAEDLRGEDIQLLPTSSV